MIYATEEEAFKRAATLIKDGIWPGVIFLTTGGYMLTYDPQYPQADDSLLP